MGVRGYDRTFTMLNEQYRAVPLAAPSHLLQHSHRIIVAAQTEGVHNSVETLVFEPQGVRIHQHEVHAVVVRILGKDFLLSLVDHRGHAVCRYKSVQ